MVLDLWKSSNDRGKYYFYEANKLTETGVCHNYIQEGGIGLGRPLC